MRDMCCAARACCVLRVAARFAGTDSLGLPPAGEPPAPGVDAAGEPAASEGYEF